MHGFEFFLFVDILRPLLHDAAQIKESASKLEHKIYKGFFKFYPSPHMDQKKIIIMVNFTHPQNCALSGALETDMNKLLLKLVQLKDNKNKVQLERKEKQREGEKSFSPANFVSLLEQTVIKKVALPSVYLTLLHSEKPKLYAILDFLSAIRLKGLLPLYFLFSFFFSDYQVFLNH